MLRRIAGLAFASSLALSLLACASASAALTPGQILVASHTHDSLLLIDPATGKQSRFAENGLPVNAGSAYFTSPGDIAIAPSGRIYVIDSSAFDGNGGVIAVDPNTGKQTEISANDQPVNASAPLFDSPNGIALTPSGKILVVDRSAFSINGGVIAVDPATGKQSVFSSNTQPVNAGSPLFEDLRGGITVLRSGTVVVGNSGSHPGLIAIDPATGEQSRFSTTDQPVNASSHTFELAVGSVESVSGRIFVSDQNGPTPVSDNEGGVIGVNPATGKATRASDNNLAVNASSQFFSNPFDITFGLDGRLVVLDTGAFGSSGCGDSEGCGGLISVNPLTGREAVISSNTQAVNMAAPLFHAISGLAVVPPRCLGRTATI